MLGCFSFLSCFRNSTVSTDLELEYLDNITQSLDSGIINKFNNQNLEILDFSAEATLPEVIKRIEQNSVENAELYLLDNYMSDDVPFKLAFGTSPRLDQKFLAHSKPCWLANEYLLARKKSYKSSEKKSP